MHAFVHWLTHPSNSYLLTIYKVLISSRHHRYNGEHNTDKDPFQIFAWCCQDLGNLMEAKTSVNCWTSEPETNRFLLLLLASFAFLAGQPAGPIMSGFSKDQKRQVWKGKVAYIMKEKNLIKPTSERDVYSVELIALLCLMSSPCCKFMLTINGLVQTRSSHFASKWLWFYSSEYSNSNKLLKALYHRKG